MLAIMVQVFITGLGMASMVLAIRFFAEGRFGWAAAHTAMVFVNGWTFTMASYL